MTALANVRSAIRALARSPLLAITAIGSLAIGIAASSTIFSLVLGLDEIVLRKGHRDFVVIVTARKEERISILGVLPDREKHTVIEFLRSIPERLKKTITTACSDMYEGYTEAIREELSQVRLVIDRFPVSRAYRDCLDEVRKTELSRLKQELPAKEYALLKGSRWALRKHKQDLSAEENKTLNRLFRLSRISKRLMTCKIV